jgi:hypothetical protein
MLQVFLLKPETCCLKPPPAQRHARKGRGR